ncbi:hypothetical protein ACPXCP_31345 [Streptomyces sp. DT20]|uniref:hypothetical protein n=1 Tax=Streptomyces sp. DT20 TaxID=3416519 RepID=UPI003CE70A7D
MPELPLAIDTRTGTIGILMGEYLGQAYLRPIHGGPEWRLPAELVRPATTEEAEAAR